MRWVEVGERGNEFEFGRELGGILVLVLVLVLE